MKYKLLLLFCCLTVSLNANLFSDTTKKGVEFEGKTAAYYAQARLFTNRYTKGKKIELMYMKKITHYTKIMFGSGKAYIDANLVDENVKAATAENNGTTAPSTSAENNDTLSNAGNITKSEDADVYSDLYALYETLFEEDELTGSGKPREETDLKINERAGDNEHIGQVGQSSVAIYTSDPIREGECDLIESTLARMCLREQANIFCITNNTPQGCGGNLPGER